MTEGIDHPRVLLIEDNPGDARLIREMLAESERIKFELIHTTMLGKGLELLEYEELDMVLLDLGLPDSQGMATFLTVHRKVPHLPIVVLTGNVDENISNQALRAGAQDYLNKSDISSELLLRSIRYAVERQALLIELEAERQQNLQKEELQLLGKLSGRSPTEATAAVFGMGPLKETLPEIFAEMVLRYEGLMDKALEIRAFKVDYNLSDSLREMGEDLGILKAMPRDVVTIHTVALNHKYDNVPAQKAKAYSGEGTYILLEIMGYLTSYYRRHMI